MYVVGLTGVIGAGKSTVARLFADRGAVVIDVDRVGHEVYEPGTEAHALIVSEFGSGVVGADGRIDRAALAKIVFSDPARLAALNAITEPRIYERVAELANEAGGRDPNAIVVLDMAILKDREHSDCVVVVVAHEDATISHLGARGMPEGEARRRIAAQPPVDVKLAIADHVIWNDGLLDALERRVDELWEDVVRAAKEEQA